MQLTVVVEADLTLHPWHHNSSNVGRVTAGQVRHNSSNVGRVTAGQVRHNSSNVGGVTAGQVRHNSSNVGGVTAGQVRHNSSNVGGVTAGQVGYNSSNYYNNKKTSMLPTSSDNPSSDCSVAHPNFFFNTYYEKLSSIQIRAPLLCFVS